MDLGTIHCQIHVTFYCLVYASTTLFPPSPSSPENEQGMRNTYLLLTVNGVRSIEQPGPSLKSDHHSYLLLILFEDSIVSPWEKSFSVKNDQIQ